MSPPHRQVFCDLENGPRSLVLELNLGLVGIHNWCQFGESTSKVKEVRDVIRFVKDRFVTDGKIDGQMDRLRAFL